MSNVKKVLDLLTANKQVDEAILKESIPALRTVINQLRKKGHLISRVFDGSQYYFIYRGFNNEYQQQQQSKTFSKAI